MPVFLVSSKKRLFHSLNGRPWLLVLVPIIVVQVFCAVPSMGVVEFPGSVEQSLLAGPLSAVSVPWSDGNSDFLFVGDDDGFLNVIYHVHGDIHFGIFMRYFLGGEIMWMGQWEGSPYGDRGLVVATANPDRLHFIEVNDTDPFINIQQTLELPEDPGMADFVGPGPEGENQLALSLPGIDQVVVIRESDGFWSINQTLATGDEPWSLVAIDLDDDKVLELVTAGRGVLSETLASFGRQSDGSYALESHVQLPGKVNQVLSEDFDLDGVEELAVSYSDIPRIDIMTGETGDWVIHHSLETSLPADYFQIVPLYGGDLSIISSVESRGMMEFFHFSMGNWIHEDSYYVGCHPRRLIACDLNGDGVNEIACLGYSDNLVSILLGNTLPGFLGFSAVPLPENPGAAIMADFDGDGVSDLLLSTIFPTVLNLYLREPGGGLSKTPMAQDVDFLPFSMAVGDFSGDPGEELVVSNINSGNLVFLSYEGASGFVNRFETPYSSSLSDLRIADIDGDGNADIYQAQSSRQQVDILFGLGERAFAPVVSLDLPFGIFDVAAIDLNQDSLLDLVATDGISRVWSLVNSGGRTFGEPVPSQANSGAKYLDVVDLDGDSDMDIVVANTNSQSITVLENIGDGTLYRRIGSLSLDGEPASVECRDMNSDQIPDIIVHLTGDQGLRIFEAISVWEYLHFNEYPTSGNVLFTLVADFNQDNQPDILNLDNDLLLGLIMFNTQWNLVSVDPTALTLKCADDKLLVEIQPDRAGPWELSVGKSGNWQVLASNGQALVGRLDFDGRGWKFEVNRSDAGHFDEETQLRLVIGVAGNEETLILPVGGNCPAENILPEISWRELPWPNPFNPRIHGRIQLDHPADVDVAVYDLAGRRVATLLKGNLQAGVHDLSWDGRRQGQVVAAGLYLLSIRSENSLLTRKIVLLK